MKTLTRWWAVGLLAAVVGCNSSDPKAGSSGGSSEAGSSAAKPAPADKPAAAAGESADVAMSKFAKSISAGDAAAIWNALPPKYQADVTALKNEFATKMDAELWNKGFATVNKLSGVLKGQKEFILKSAMTNQMAAGAGAGPEEMKKVEDNWETLVTLVDTLAKAEISTIDGLKKADVGHFLSSTGTTLATTVIKSMPIANEAAAEAVKATGDTKFELVKQEGDKATLKVTEPGSEPKEKEFTKVDGKWLPSDVVNDWESDMARAKSNLAALSVPPDVKAGILDVLAKVDGALDKLASAKTQEEFDTELGTAVGSMLPIIGSLGGGGGAGMSGPPPDLDKAPTDPSAPGPGPGGLTPPTITPPKLDIPKPDEPKTP